jgi:hypothetical protein
VHQMQIAIILCALFIASLAIFYAGRPDQSSPEAALITLIRAIESNSFGSYRAILHPESVERLKEIPDSEQEEAFLNMPESRRRIYLQFKGRIYEPALWYKESDKAGIQNKDKGDPSVQNRSETVMFKMNSGKWYYYATIEATPN